MWSMVSGLLGINWVFVGSLTDELSAQAGFCKKQFISHSFNYLLGGVERKK